jgi:hypothetical protein
MTLTALTTLSYTTSFVIIPEAMGLFSGVAYILSSSLRADDQNLLSANLDTNGATQSSLKDATHIITDTLEFEGWELAPKHAEVVTVSSQGPLLDDLT